MIKFITSEDCNCKDFNTKKFSQGAYIPKYFLEEGYIEHIFRDYTENESHFSIHLKGKHINNIIVDGISVRRIGQI